MIIYISGKMSDLTKEEYQPIFNQAAERLRADGHRVINPADDDWVEKLNYSSEKVYGLSVREYESILLADLQFLLGIKTADPKNTAIFMLNNWEQSGGAQAEYYFAKAIGMNIIMEDDYLAGHRYTKVEILNIDELKSDIECYRKMFPNTYTTMDEVKRFLLNDYNRNEGNTGLFGISVSDEWEDKCFSFEFRGVTANNPTYEYMGIYKC